MKRALAFLAAVAIGAAAWAEENAADSFWAGPGGVGDWGGPNWFYTLRNGNSYFTEGKTAYFTNETSVIDLGGRTFDVYTLRNPLANGERVSVTVTNGTLSLVFPVASSDGEDVFNLRNIDLVGGAGANIVNTYATSGFQLLRSSGITLKDGATLTETYSDQSTSKFNVGYNATSGTSNFVYIAAGSSLYTPRYIQIGGSNSETLHPTGVVTVAGANASLDAQEIWLGYVDAASASGGYGGLFVTDGARAVSRSTFLMGADFTTADDIYRGVSELVVSGEGSSLEVGSSEADKNFSVREYGTKKVLVENGGRLTVHGEFRNYAANDHIHAFDVTVKNGGVLEFKNIYFSNHDSTRMDMPGQGKCSFTVDGGTTRALAPFTTATANGDGALHAVTVGENGWTFDTQNFDVIWKRTINFGTGTFTKTGSGYFEFNYVPTFPGTIDVREGHIGLAGSSAKFPGAFVLRSGTAFLKTVEFSSEQDASFTLEADSILQPYQSSSSAAPVAIRAQSFTLPETGAVKIRLGDSGANTAPVGAHPLVTILGEGVFTQADLAKFVCMSSDAVKSLALSADGKSIVLNVGTPDVCVWTGATGDGLFSTEGNWAGGVKPTVGDTTPIVFAANGGVADNDIGTLSPAWIEFRSGAGGIEISGANGFTGVAAITNLSTSTMKFNAPVTFAGTYSVVKSGAVVFAGGATATYPDAAQRTSSSSDLNRTLSGSFTFTGDWSVPDLGTADKPWIIPSGSEVHGKLLTGTQTNRKRILRIENNASAHFTVMTNGWSIGDIDVNGTLEVDGEVVVKTYKDKDGWSNFGTSGNTGTVKAGKFAKVDSSYVYSRIPNLIVGAGGIGSIVKDWSWRFYSNTTVKTGDSDFEFLGVYNSGSTSDWGVFLASGVTLTVDVGEGRTVIMGAGVYGDGGAGTVRKTGAGTLVMSNTHNGQSGFTKSYTKGTTVEGGTLKVLPNGMPASGTVTFHAGTTLAVPGDAVVALGTALAFAGEGTVGLVIGDGSELAVGDYPVLSTTEMLPVGSTVKFTVQTPTASEAALYSTDGKTLRLAVGGTAYAGPKVWTGAAGDGKLSTAGNWLLEKVPVSGDDIVIDTVTAGTIDNDLGLDVKSITFGSTTAPVTITGNGFTGVAAVTNLSQSVQTLNVPVAFSGTYCVHSEVAEVNFAGGATATAPDSSITSDTLASHTLKGNITFTADWTIANQPAGKPFVIASGSTVTGQNLAASSYQASNYHLRVEEGGVGSFYDINVDGKLVFKVDGRLVARRYVKVNGGDSGTPGRVLGYSGGNSGSLEGLSIYKSTTGYGYVDIYMPKMVVGGEGDQGFGMYRKDYCFRLFVDAELTAQDDFTVYQPISGDGPKDGDWGINLNGKTLTVDTAGHTVVFDSYVHEADGTIVKKGEGEMTMKSRQKRYRGGTVVKGGTLTVSLAGAVGSGPMTVESGATLKIASTSVSLPAALSVEGGATLALPLVASSAAPVSLGTAFEKTGEGKVKIVLGDGSAIADGDYPVATTGVLPNEVNGVFELVNETSSDVRFYTPDRNTLRVAVGTSVELGACVWIGAAGDGKFSTAGNWYDGNVPGNGSSIVFAADEMGCAVNDLGDLQIDSVTFAAGSAPLGIEGGKFTLVKAVTNLASSVQSFYNEVEFAGEMLCVQSGYAVSFLGGAKATRPASAMRTSSSSDTARTLRGKFTFTEDWSVPGLGDSYDKPWIVLSGSEVRGKLFTGTQTNRKRILSIENNASAHFTVMTNGWSIGDIDVNGTLEVDGEVVVKTYTGDSGWSNLGTAGNTGTVKAERFVKIGNSYARSNIPNLTVGKGGLGCIIQDWRWQFDVNTTVKAGDNFEFLGLHNGSDWGIRMSKNITLTIDVGEGKIVTLGCGVTSDTGGAIKKTGAGLLVMNDVTGGTTGHTKSYSGGTTIEEGTVRFEAASFGTGAVTVKDGAVLELVPGSTLPSGNAVTLENGATLSAPESGTAAQIGGACTFATNSTLEFVISGTANSSFAFTSAPTGAATVKFSSGFNPNPGETFILATGVSDACTFTLDSKYPGELKVENGNLVYKARDYFYIRLTKNDEDDDGLNVDPVWFCENSMLGNSIDDDTVKSTAPNGMSYIDSYLMGYEPLDPDSNFKLTGASGDDSGEFKAAATFNIPAHSPKNGGTYKAEAVLLGSDDGVSFSRVANVKPVDLTPGAGNQVVEFSFKPVLGDREMRFFA